jgi:hypothetical protein
MTLSKNDLSRILSGSKGLTLIRMSRDVQVPLNIEQLKPKIAWSSIFFLISSTSENVLKVSVYLIKGIVQRKLRWVEIFINRQLLFYSWGAEHSFLILKGHHLGFYIKPFAATWAQIIGNVRKNCEALQIVYEVLHIV